MLVTNPIDSVAFKRLIKNNKAVAFFIGVLPKKTIKSIIVRLQEIIPIAKASATAFRMSCLAAIKTETGELKRMLIEIQKVGHLQDLLRFRNRRANSTQKTKRVDGGLARFIPIAYIKIFT